MKASVGANLASSHINELNSGTYKFSINGINNLANRHAVDFVRLANQHGDAALHDYHMQLWSGLHDLQNRTLEASASPNLSFDYSEDLKEHASEVGNYFTRMHNQITRVKELRAQKQQQQEKEKMMAGGEPVEGRGVEYFSS